jgi:cytochrome c nitrite reductase small subunit
MALSSFGARNYQCRRGDFPPHAFAHRRRAACIGRSATRSTPHTEPPLSLLPRTGTLFIAIAVLVGVAAGLGAFTFWYGEGGSYLSSNPEACVNCHIMQPQYDEWVGSSHTAVAGCVDCHLPHQPVRKWISKAENGWFHSVAFTLQNFPEPIRIKPRNLRIVQDNCVACHSQLVHEMLPATADVERLSCIHCHADVGHAGR